MPSEEYTWLRYYEDLYLRQKKINNNLAMQLGETTAKNGELSVALNRVIGSSFWRALAPARKIYAALKKQPCTPENSQDDISADMVLYNKRLQYYEDFYSQWIKKNPIEEEYITYSDASGMSRVREAAFAVLEYEDLVGSNLPDINAEEHKWILFVSKKGKLANGYAKRLSEALLLRPEALIGYADEDYFYDYEGQMIRIEPNFKPEWSPDTLDSFFYMGNICMIRSDLANKLEWLGTKNCQVNLYDFFLQAADYVGKHFDDSRVIHVPQVLFHNEINYLPKEDNTCFSMRKAVSDSLKNDLADGKLTFGHSEEFNYIKMRTFERRQTHARFISGQFLNVNQISYDVPSKTQISVLILSKDHPDTLRTCISSIIERTDLNFIANKDTGFDLNTGVNPYNIEFIIVDNGSTDENKIKYEEMLAELLANFRYQYIYEKMEFNFSKQCNIAAEAASGNLLLFMNDDIEIMQKDWLKLMAGYACLPHVGAVGAKLLYANTDKIQHVGVTSMEIGPSHKLVMYPDDQEYYYGKNVFAHDMLAVTAACMMVESIKFKQAGGFNEDFAVAYNDVDFCMRITKQGLTNIQCNGAVLYHYESLTRGLDEINEEKWNRLLIEKHNLYLIHPEFFENDPYYNPNLIGNHSNYLSNYDFGYNIHVKHEIIRQLDASKLAETSSEELKYNIERADLQLKHNLEEADIYEVRGWSFLPGRDNSGHGVRIILQREEDGRIWSVDSDSYPREDLVSTFADETNLALCGFVSKFLKADLSEGTYRIGLEPTWLKDDLTTFEDTAKIIYTDSRIYID